MAVVGRFAPSPSGRMHLGNVFSALLAWCSAKSQGGSIVLRIEDLDPDRCRPEYAAALKEDLLWLGLAWDEEQTPQSRRAGAYERCFDALQRQGLVYPCFCSRTELHAASAPHGSDGSFVYSGACRHLTQKERRRKEKAPAWRVMVPPEDIAVEDGLQGLYRQRLDRDCGDFIIRRADGVYAYQLAVVADDAAGGITEVVRGRDLLSSAPRQVFLQRALGFPSPRYYHVPLLLAPDGRRLSKREKDLDMGALRSRWTPEALLGYLAGLCGLAPQGTKASAQELASAFSWDKVGKDNLIILNLDKML